MPQLNVAKASDPNPGLVWRYQVEDHLGSSTVELTAAGDVLGFEQYYPYGDTAYCTEVKGKFSRKRYRYKRDGRVGFAIMGRGIMRGGWGGGRLVIRNRRVG